jgi:hypothetical protein
MVSREDGAGTPNPTSRLANQTEDAMVNGPTSWCSATRRRTIRLRLRGNGKADGRAVAHESSHQGADGKTIANGCTEVEATAAAELVGCLLERYALSMRYAGGRVHRLRIGEAPSRI